MWRTCPEVIISVGSAAEADPLLTAFLSTHPTRESAPQWLREEAIPQAIRCLMEQVMGRRQSADFAPHTSPPRGQGGRPGSSPVHRRDKERGTASATPIPSIRSSLDSNQLPIESPLTPTLSPLSKGGEGEGSGGIQKLEISVWLTTNDEMASLNARYRGINVPTDVLSFPAEVPAIPIPEIPLGDVVVSVEQAAQQAEPNGHDFLTELLMLCLHGTLHLLGYDDQTDAQRAHMNQIAARTLRMLGYPAKEEWFSRHYER